jgi:hypothetical protein
LTPDNCEAVQNSFNTKLTSLFDIKYRSLFRPGNQLTNIQYALEVDGTMRQLPTVRSETVSYPTTCWPQDISTPRCYAQWVNSSCNPNWVNPVNGNGGGLFCDILLLLF